MDISYKLHENVSSLLSITGLTGHGLVRQFLHRLAKGPHTHDPKTDNACRTKTGRPTKGFLIPPPLQLRLVTGFKIIYVNMPDRSLIVPLRFPSWKVPCPAEGPRAFLSYPIGAQRGSDLNPLHNVLC